MEQRMNKDTGRTQVGNKQQLKLIKANKTGEVKLGTRSRRQTITEVKKEVTV